jgi:LPS export ABC transporter protein LptC
MNEKKISILFIIVFAIIGLFSCENNIEVVKSLSAPDKVPDITMDNMETIYSDSAKVKGRVVAPVVDRYESGKKRCSEFPKGIHVYFYNDSLNVKAEVIAKYAIYYDKPDLYEARNDVVVINTKGEKLNTEQLFWDRQKKIIYSKKYCRITMPDGMQQVGENGMMAKENFESWALYGGSGSVPIKDATE